MESQVTAATPRADYGLDAPAVIRNLSVAAALGLAVFISARVGLWSGSISLGTKARLDLTWMGLGVALGCGPMALHMTWSSKLGKLRCRDRLLEQIPWKGSERVLDVGCGRGLLLIGAAKRLTTGSAIGVDIWQAEDLSGNRPEATLENARREGVLERVRVETADMRKLPFADASFDVIVSRAAIHNIYEAAERAKAIAEIARVLAPSGRVLIDDIRHIPEYEAGLRAHGVADIRWLTARASRVALALITMGALRPGALLAAKQ